jgi:hypothetical protein
MTRYLVYRCGGTGLGHNLFSIDRCAGFARLTGRRLALDFRRFQYFPEDAHAQFFKLFRPCAPHGPEVLIDLEEIDRIYALPDRRVLAAGSMGLYPDRDFAEEAVLIFGGYCDLAGAAVDGRNPNLTMDLLPPFRDMVEETIGRAMGGRRTVGVHFRHGNGEVLHGRPGSADITFSAVYDLIRREYVEKVNALVREMGDARVLITSDNADFVRYVAERVPNPTVLSSVLPDEPYQKFIRARGHDFAILRDAVIDMWALARCDKLVCGVSSFSWAAMLHSRKLAPEDVTVVGHARQEVVAKLVPLSLRIRQAEINAAGTVDQTLWTAVLDLYRQANRLADAEKLEKQLSHLRRGDHNPHWCPQLVEALCASGNREAAIVALERGLAEDPANPALHASLGRLLEEAGRLPEALVHLEAAARLAPRSLENLRHLSAVQRKAGRRWDAVASTMRSAALAWRLRSKRRKQAGEAARS